MKQEKPDKTIVRVAIAETFRKVAPRGPIAIRNEGLAGAPGNDPWSPLARQGLGDRFIDESLERAAWALREDDAVDPKDRGMVLDIAQESYRRLRDGGSLDMRGAIMLEAIQLFDGTRPAIVLEDDGVPLHHPQLGDWQDEAREKNAAIKAVAPFVALVALPDGPKGTGFRVGPDLLLTNRHVLELIGTETAQGWKILPGTQARFPAGTEEITGVAFAGAQPVGGLIDLMRLDAAVLRLSGSRPDHVRADDRPSGVAGTGPLVRERQLHIIGYPLDLGVGAIVPEADRLFHGRIGKLCWMPGLMKALPGEGFGDLSREWAFGYDISTLAGNSGSFVGDLQGEAALALGLHIGGTTGLGNWAHWLSGASNLLRGHVDFAPVSGGTGA